MFDLCMAHPTHQHICANAHVLDLAHGGMHGRRHCFAVDRACGTGAPCGQARVPAGCAEGALRASAARRVQQRECVSIKEKRLKNRWGDQGNPVASQIEEIRPVVEQK